jgi:serine/tyrosine/threonine adenylyltransferase
VNAPEKITARWPGRDADFWQSLGEGYGAAVPMAGLPEPHWVAQSPRLAQDLGIGAWMRSDDALATLSGNGGAPTPFCSVYSGHQFGVWAGQLGDGRAHLLGELGTPLGPMEVQLKGAGRTPYSRFADGRAVLRSSIREFLCSETMAALGIPTTRALAVTGSAQPVRRETMETAAIVTRVAPSFLRFGHFEHFTHTARDVEALRHLVHSAIERYFPELQAAEHPARDVLQEVAVRTATLLAQWQAVGFCHGVMNTDNMSLLGLTLDYGPFGFMDAFDFGHICNHSDEQGRYAFARQPGIAFWNLHALAQALLPAVDLEPEAASQLLLAALEPYKETFARSMLSQLRQKLGLATERDDDAALADDFVRLMAQDRADHTITWRRLSHGVDAARDCFIDRAAFDAWAERYQSRCAQDSGNASERQARMLGVNPKFVLRNHLAQAAIERAQAGDFSEVRRLLGVLERPFDEQPEHEADAGFPPDWASQLEVSCSS